MHQGEAGNKDPPAGSSTLVPSTTTPLCSQVDANLAPSSVSAGVPSGEPDAAASLHDAAALSVVGVQSSNGKATKRHLVVTVTMIPSAGQLLLQELR